MMETTQLRPHRTAGNLAARLDALLTAASHRLSRRPTAALRRLTRIEDRQRAARLADVERRTRAR